MGISNHLKEIGRGKDGARALSREQAEDLMGQILDGQVTDLELGAFCIAMRVKGETPDELAGFLDAIHHRLPAGPACPTPTVVLPSYNGARKLPVLTPLLALLLAQQGVRVWVHGQTQDPGRVTTFEILKALKPLFPSMIHVPVRWDELGTTSGVYFMHTGTLLPGLQRLLDARRVIGLRNSAHSLVKLLQPAPGALLVSSYTHPEYLQSMGQLLELTGQHAMLLRGTEGEPVADPRRTPQMDMFNAGVKTTVQIQQTGPLALLPDLPGSRDIASTAAYICALLDGEKPLPTPIQQQVHHLLVALNTACTAPSKHLESAT
ncbi:MAG: DNA-binding protein YbiB [Burkholderiaceae bacterium]|nr:DNA-binding protein YbiB [Burkholderiaceae bacterium]